MQDQPQRGHLLGLRESLLCDQCFEVQKRTHHVNTVELLRLLKPHSPHRLQVSKKDPKQEDFP